MACGPDVGRSPTRPPLRYGHADVVRLGTGKNRTIPTEVPMKDDDARGLLHLRHETVQASIERIDGRPATSVPRMLIDLGSGAAPYFDRAWKEADFLNLIVPEAVDAELASTRRKGASRVRKQLNAERELLTAATDLRTRLETAFFAIVVAAGLPLPETNVRVDIGSSHYYPDFLWRLLGLAIEVDGPHHMKPSRVEGDKLRDVDFFNHGIDVLRFSDRSVYKQPGTTRAKVAAAYARQLERTPAPVLAA